MIKRILAALLLIGFLYTPAHADDRALTIKGFKELLLKSTAPASTDWIPFFQQSSQDVLKFPASLMCIQGGTVQAGSTSVAGHVKVYPGTANGYTDFTATSNSGNTVTTINTAAQAGARTYTIPDAGGSASFVMSNMRAFAEVNICGDLTTINNNTVYYKPDTTLTANTINGLKCDITAAGGTTESSNNAAVFGAQAVNVYGMTCRDASDAGADVSFTLRDAAGATVPSVTCTIPSGSIDCVANVQTTTAIAAGDKIDIAAASTGNLGSDGFVCEIFVGK